MSNNKQQTAVEYFAKEIFYTIELLKKGYVNDQDLLNTIIVISDKAKEMEKAEKIKFATDFFFWWYNQTSGTNTYEAVEKFYNETYGGNK